MRLVINYTLDRALSWTLSESTPDGPKVVILKHMFDPAVVESHDFYTDLKLDIGTECATFGPLQKVKVFNVRCAPLSPGRTDT